MCFFPIEHTDQNINASGDEASGGAEEQLVEEEEEAELYDRFEIEEEIIVPATFEEFNAMFRPTDSKTVQFDPNVEEITFVQDTTPLMEEFLRDAVSQGSPEMPEDFVIEEQRIEFISTDDTPEVQPYYEGYNDMDEEFEDELYGEEEEEDVDPEFDLEEEEDLYEGDEEYEEELSDVDDSELMRKLDEKYGKLPQKSSHSDGEPWTSNALFTSLQLVIIA